MQVRPGRRLPVRAFAAVFVAVLLPGQSAAVATAPHGLSGSFGENGTPATVVSNSGGMTYAVPFDLPPARGDAQPALSIQYQSGNGTGEAGLGWSLSLPSIERAPLSGWPKYLDSGNPADEDRFTYGGQPLTFVCVVGGTPSCPTTEQVGPMPAWAAGFRHYRLVVEGSFERFFLSPGRQTWIVQRRGGELLEFGAPRIRPDLTGPAGDVDAGGAIFRWNLARQHDLHGSRNLVVYDWAGAAPQRQHLRDIYYTPPAVGGDNAPTEAFAFHVALSWQSPANAQRHYARADKRRPELLLRRVAVSSKTWAGTGPREFVRAYNLTYFPQRTIPGAAGEAPLWARPSLQAVQAEGRCPSPIAETAGHLPDPTSCAVLPPTTFSYQPARLATGTAVRVPLNGPGTKGKFDFVTSTALVDINRDGLPDIVQAWPSNYRRPTYKAEYNICTNGDFIIDSGADPSAHDPVLSCSPDDGTHSVFDIRSARQHEAWISRKTAASSMAFDHRCLDAGGVEPASLTYYQVAGSYGYAAREPSLFTQYGAEAMGDWGNSAMLWSLAGYSGFGFAPAVMDVHGQPPHDEGYDPATFLKFCPEAVTNPAYPALRWKKIDDPNWAHNAPGKDVPDSRHYTIVDIDGDGYPDLLTDTVSPADDGDFRRASIRFSRKLSRLEGTLDQPGPGLYPFSTFGGAPVTVTALAAYSAYADLDGDGIVDLVTSSPWAEAGVPQVRPGDGRGGFGCAAPSDPLCKVPGNGTWLGNAYRISSPDLVKPWPLAGDDSYGIAGTTSHFFHDVTGDGLDDIVAYTPAHAGSGVVPVGRIQLWINAGGGQFRCAHAPDCVVATITGDEQPTGAHRVLFADIDGNGTEDFVLLGSNGIWTFSFLATDAVPPVGGRSPRPGLLTRIDNGVGAVTDVVYETTQELDAQFTDAGLLVSFHAPWTSHVPVVVPVVTRIATRDQKTAAGGPSVEPYTVNRTTRFEYRDPAYDPWERSFKGFQRVRSIRPSGEVEQTWFWYGDCARDGFVSVNCMPGSDESTDKALMGVPVRVDRFRPGVGPRPDEWLLTTTMRYDRDAAFIVPPGQHPDRPVSFSRIGDIDTYVYDTALGVSNVDASAHPSSRQQVPKQGGAEAHVRSTSVYDAAGNLQSSTEFGRVAADGTALDTTVRTDTLPALHRCLSDWACLPREATVTERRPDETQETLLRHHEFGYSASSDLNQVASHLDYPRSQRAALQRNLLLGTGQPSTASTVAGKRQLRTFVFDKFGNVTSSRGHSPSALTCSKTSYDPAFQQFAATMTSYAGTACTGAAITTRQVVDRGLGAPSKTMRPNGGLERIDYDPFGRPAAIYAPAPDQGPLSAVLAATIAYHTQAPVPWVEIVGRADVDASLTSIEVFNGLGEQVLGFDQADVAADGAPWVLREWVERDGAGNVEAAYRPWFFSGDPRAVANGALAQSAAGTRLSASYDPFGRTLFTFDGALPTSRLMYKPLALVRRDAEQLKAAGPFSAFQSASTVDGHGRVIETQRPAGNDTITTRTKYLGTGEPLEIVRFGKDNPADPYRRELQWDSFGRLIHNYEPNTIGSTAGGPRGWHYVYDDEGRLVGTSDARGCGKNLTYDAVGRVVAEDHSPCTPDQPAYTPPNLKTGDGTEVWNRYDTYEPGQTAPSPGFTDAASFAVGKLVSTRDRAAWTRFDYDGRGLTRRITRRMARPGPATASLSTRYSPHWFRQDLRFDLANRMVERSTGLERDELTVAGKSAETMKYSARGALREIGSSYGNIVNALTFSPSGQPLHVRYGDRPQTQTALGYDPRDRLLKSQTWRAAPTLWTDPPPPGYSLPGPETTELTLNNLEFGYDDVGNPKTINDSSADSWPAGSRPTSRSFLYDSAYRLRQVDYQHNHDAQVAVFRHEAQARDGRPIAELQATARMARELFAYDWQGNTLFADDDQHLRFDRSPGKMQNGAVTDGVTTVPNQLIASEGLRARHDDAGNLIELVVEGANCWTAMPLCSHRFRYDWDETGQLMRAKRWDYPAGPVPAFDSAAAPSWDLAYAYTDGARARTTTRDAQGNADYTLEVFDTLSVSHTRFDEATGDYEAAPQQQMGLVGGIGRVFYDREQKLPRAGPTPLHVFLDVFDHLRSSVFVIDKDSGEVVERTSYAAYGATESDFRSERWGGFREAFKFGGKQEDIEVGATCFGARYYNARLGRWMSPDPSALHALSGDLNPYAYVGGRVTTQVDPTGLDAASDPPVDTVDVKGPPVDTVEVKGPPRGSPERKAELATARAEALAAASQVPNAGNLVRGTAHLPIPLTAKAYITPNGVRKSIVNSANSMLTGLLDPVGYRHLARLAGLDIEGAFQIKVGEDDDDYSKPVGTGLFLVASVIVDRFTAPPAPAAEATGNTVYRALNAANEVEYVGITNNLARRAAEHLRGKGINIAPVLPGLSRGDARAVEQALIEVYGLQKNGGTLINRINSIAKSNPEFAAALTRGQEILRLAGYQ